MSDMVEAEKSENVCPNCLGRGKVMGFAAPDRRRNDPGGWKAVTCPYCQGSGQAPANVPEVAEGDLSNLPLPRGG